MQVTTVTVAITVTVTTTNIRSTQTASDADGQIHIFTVCNSTARCPVTGPLVRTGRKPLTAVTCAACLAEYPKH